MARTRPVLPNISEVDRLQPKRSRAVKQPGRGGRFGRPSAGGKTPAHLHRYTGTAPGGLGKSFYPRADPPRRSRRKHLLSLPPLRGPKPHNRVAHEVRHYQRTTNLLVQRQPFEELVRYIASKVTSSPEFSGWEMTHVRFTPEALQALQEASEYFLVKAFEHSCRVTAIAKRKTCFPEDLQMGIDLRDRAL